jgi:hypothetical protein
MYDRPVLQFQLRRKRDLRLCNGENESPAESRKFSTILNYIISNFTTKLTTLSALSSLVVKYHEFWQGYTAPCHHHLDIHGNLPLHDCDYPMILCPGQKTALTDDIQGPRGLNNAA